MKSLKRKDAEGQGDEGRCAILGFLGLSKRRFRFRAVVSESPELAFQLCPFESSVKSHWVIAKLILLKSLEGGQTSIRVSTCGPTVNQLIHANHTVPVQSTSVAGKNCPGPSFQSRTDTSCLDSSRMPARARTLKVLKANDSSLNMDNMDKDGKLQLMQLYAAFWTFWAVWPASSTPGCLQAPCLC